MLGSREKEIMAISRGDMTEDIRSEREHNKTEGEKNQKLITENRTRPSATTAHKRHQHRQLNVHLPSLLSSQKQ